ncbi:MAG TPA: hypothetical protein VMU63_02615 [Acidimicrobiales bacterium]|nr:hypothetical protein [Acidimicrobiales bacterium]
MAEPDRRLHFGRDDTDPVLDEMRAMTRAGRGWINIEPEVPEDAEVPGVGLFSFMSARGPSIPLCTWVPEGQGRRQKRTPPSLGIQHPSGVKAAARLAERGLPLPAGWRVTQDHPKRGLVVSVADPRPLPPGASAFPGTGAGGAGADEAAMLEWLLRAGELLSVVPPTGIWNAAVYFSGA